MNLSPSNPTRWLCCLVRGGSLGLGRDPLPPGEAGFRARHVAACDSCTRHFNALRNLDTQLMRDARQAAPAMPAGLDQRIIRAVNRSIQPVTPMGRGQAWLPWAGALAGIAIALLFLALQRGPGAAGSGGTQPLLVVSLAGNESGVAHLWRSLAPPAGELLAKNPLQDEAELVYSDARSAVRFLALNFLPSPMPAPEPAMQSPPHNGV